MPKTVKPTKIIEIGIQETLPRVFVLFLQTAHAVEKYTDKELYFKAGLSMPKLAVLQILKTNGGTMMPSTIAAWMLVEKHNMTTLIDRLRRDELVRVERGTQADRRVAQVILTDKGRQTLKQASPVNQKIIQKIMANLDEDTAASLEKVLKILRINAVEGLNSILPR